MAEALACDFDDWLKFTLVALNTDDEVFSPYIKGILEGDENAEEKLEALQGILTEITENGIDDLCQDILKKWNLRDDSCVEDVSVQVRPLREEGHVEDVSVQVGLDEKLAKIMGEQAQCVVTTKSRSRDEENLKSAILAQYSQVSDGEVTDSDQEEEGSGGLGIRNTNAEEVIKAERRRDKDKEESQRKKEKDKEDSYLVMLGSLVLVVEHHVMQIVGIRSVPP
ncbi:Coiled-coil domain-containing protein 43-like [Homarus americanus]|uniref:Coiled-coil domain-containing protein 43 n=1 Tax=Homarus americanus TaxID=6706 RepID=A0A8J5JWM9_HOMAM|nr:Coiled-coil domain-containing protein 43-like [Homarus americanus]